jgi:hypothetical protein
MDMVGVRSDGFLRHHCLPGTGVPGLVSGHGQSGCIVPEGPAMAVVGVKGFGMVVWTSCITDRNTDSAVVHLPS